MHLHTTDPSGNNAPTSTQPLKGKTALITGAASGIGAAAARRLAKLGAHVVVTDIEVDEGRALAKLLGPRGEFRRLDVREPAQWETVIDQLERTRGLDILVNNAGTHGMHHDTSAQDPEHCGVLAWRELQRTNVEGMFLGCRHAIMAMKPSPEAHAEAKLANRTKTKAGRGGVIINVAASAGRVGMPSAAAYAASQAAVLSHTKSVALYCARENYGIRCNALVLGPILTRMWDPVLGRGEQRHARMQAMRETVPLGRFGQAEEVADAIAFLASDASSFMNGAELTLDGGMGAGPMPAALPTHAAPAPVRTVPPATYETDAPPLYRIAR